MLLVVVIFIFLYASPYLSISARKLLPSNQGRPEIWLHSLTVGDSMEIPSVENDFRTKVSFENDFVAKNGTEYTVLDDTDQVVFVCQAPFPVMWSLPHQTQTDQLIDSYSDIETYTQRFSVFPNDQKRPVDKYFGTFLLIRFFGFPFFSVTFTCSASDETQTPLRQSSSIHIYFFGKRIIERQGETIEVYVAPSKDEDLTGESTVIFPCRPASPNIKILLEKQMENKNNPNGDTKKWKRFKYPTKYVSYDHKVGFSMTKDTIGKRSYIFGLYRCLAIDDGQSNNKSNDEYETSKLTGESKYVYINVTTHHQDVANLQDTDFQTVQHFEGNSSVVKTISEYFEMELKCCSGIPSQPPTIHEEFCQDHLQCQLLKTRMWRMLTQRNSEKLKEFYFHDQIMESGVSDDCTKSIFYSPNVVALCRGETLKYLEYIVQVFSDNVMPVSKRPGGSKTQSLIKLITDAEAYTVGLSQKIFVGLGYITPFSKLSQNSNYDILNGVTLRTSWISFHEDTDYDFLDFNLISHHAKSHPPVIAEYPRDILYEGETFLTICLGFRMWYAEGIHTRIVWANGTSRSYPMQGEHRTKKIYFTKTLDISQLRLSQNQFVYKLSGEITAEKGMAFTECWLPRWNATGWDKISKQLVVKDASIPGFLKSESNTTIVVYVYLGEENGKTLEFQILDGAPEATITVRKDNKVILHTGQEKRNVSSTFKVTLSKTVKADNQNGSRENNGIITVTITFEKVIYEVQGLYRCEVGNIKGNVFRAFRVIVTERVSIFRLTLAVSLIISSVLLLGIGWWRWREKMNVRILRLN